MFTLLFITFWWQSSLSDSVYRD